MPLSVAEPLLELSVPHDPAALVGYLGAGKTRALQGHYEKLLRSGYRAERVLVLVANGAHAAHWKEFIRAFDFAHGEPQVLTFRSWVRRELLLNWARVEASGHLPGPPKGPEPHFAGITASQQILREVTGPLIKKFPALEKCYTAPIHQLIQVLDSYARLVEHGLPAEEARAWLDKGHYLGPASSELHLFVSEAIASYRAFCFEHRVLDYTVQLELFHRVLWPQDRYRERLHQSLDVLLVDNIEETIPVAQEVIEELSASLQGLVVAHDLNGGLREFLGGDVVGARQLIERLGFAPRVFETRSPHSGFAEALAEAVLAGSDAEPPPAIQAPGIVIHSPRTLRVQMFESLDRRIGELLESGERQGEIVVIAPVVDPLLTWHLQQTLASRGKALRVLTGSNRVIDHRPVRILVTLSRLARPEWKAPPSDHDVAEMLEVLLGLHALEAIRLQQLVYPERSILAPADLTWPPNLTGFRASYEAIFAWIGGATESAHPLDRLFESAFADLYAPWRLRDMAPDSSQTEADTGHYRWSQDDALAILQIDQLIQGARSFRRLGAAIGLSSIDIPKHFLRSIYAGELAERPLIPKGTLPEAVTLFTAAKYAEEGPPAKHQLWVDASAPQWHKSDVRELTNPRVLSRHWEGGHYTDEDDLTHQAEKLARTLHTVALKCTGAIEVFSSDYSSDGSELCGDLAYWLSELVPGTSLSAVSEWLNGRVQTAPASEVSDVV